jgi:translin
VDEGAGVGVGADEDRASELDELAASLRFELGAAHEAREKGLAACRRTIRSCGLAIRALHRGQLERAAELRDDARVALLEAQEALAPYPAVAFAGFLHDAEKEYAEASLTASLVDGHRLASATELAVQPAAWFNGLAEAASELRRALLDRLRTGRYAEAESMLMAMEDVYDLLVTIDFPDALTGGLRRTTDSLRAVLERTRSDLTLTLLQARLHDALANRPAPADEPLS